MPLPLTDPRWSELQSSYNGTEDVVTWLTEAYEQGGLSRERLGDLINEAQHQGDTSTAMYAVATHLIELARRAPRPEDALNLLTHAGVIYANSEVRVLSRVRHFYARILSRRLQPVRRCCHRFFHSLRTSTLTSGQLQVLLVSSVIAVSRGFWMA